MLPSADAAMVAFAEVTSFVRFYADSQAGAASGGACPKLFAELRDGKEPDAALLAASGADLKAWDARWRAYLATRPPRARCRRSSAWAARTRPRRKPTRCAISGTARGWRSCSWRASHAPEALKELDRIELARAPVVERGLGPRHGRSERPLAARPRPRRGAGAGTRASRLMADPSQVLSSYGPWWAIRGRWARAGATKRRGGSSFDEAVAARIPSTRKAACETLDPAGCARPIPASKASPRCARQRGRPASPPLTQTDAGPSRASRDREASVPLHLTLTRFERGRYHT